jgi:plastocyanin
MERLLLSVRAYCVKRGMTRVIRIRRALSGIMAIGLIAALTSLAAAQDDQEWVPETPEVTVRLVEMTMTDFKLDPGALTLPSGAITFAILNRGVIDHNLAIENSQRQILASSASFSAGRSGTFDVTLTPGNYTMVCTLPAHREAGMVGTLTITE